MYGLSGDDEENLDQDVDYYNNLLSISWSFPLESCNDN